MLSVTEPKYIHKLVGIVLFLLLGSIAAGQKPRESETQSRKPGLTSVRPGTIQVPVQPNLSLFKSAQGQQHTEIHFDPRTGMVTLQLLVQDPSGYFVPNIRRDNFVVYENGIRQNNATVEIEHAPVALAVLMECGGRYHQLRKALSQEVSNASRQLLDELSPDDRIAVWKYGDNLESLVSLSPVDHTHTDVFDMSKAPAFSESNLYDALISTLKCMQPLSGRKALILISSGIDTFSKAKYEDVLMAARASGTPIYVVGLSPVLRRVTELSEPTGPFARIDWKQADQQLMEIATVSGGRAYLPESTVDLSPTYDVIMENLRIRVFVYRVRLPRSLRTSRASG